MRLFSAQLSAPVAEELWRRRKEMVARGQLVPMRLEATVLFADINDFTAISEQLEPETIVRWLNPYMEAMSRLVEEHGGIVERLAGDAIMAMFGVPIARRGPPEVQADALAAVRYACRMTDAVRELNASYRREGLPEIRVGIGIHSGVLVGCCLGGPERQQYATIGDSANTAARLMTVAKELMKHPGTDEVCRIVLSESTRILLRGVFELRPLGPVALKGKRLPLECYAVEPGGAGA
jgi:adenylate cyclase